MRIDLQRVILATVQPVGPVPAPGAVRAWSSQVCRGALGQEKNVMRATNFNNINSISNMSNISNISYISNISNIFDICDFSKISDIFDI